MATTTTASSYAECVSSLRSSLQFLESSVETLDNGVADFPRLVNVLKTVRVYTDSLSFLSLSMQCLNHFCHQ
jgi:DASH complex subunit SPC19